ncbi:MAG: hypothetical protein ACXVEF_05535 [Polyangiales bacterium]
MTERSLRLRTDERDGRTNALRKLTFIVREDGCVLVVDDGSVVDRYASFARALRSYGLRRTQLVPLE